jgi:hypothetical protein
LSKGIGRGVLCLVEVLKTKGFAMGREIRKVPANWDHPKTERPNGRIGLQPMYDCRFENAAAEWKADLAKWEAGERPSYYTIDDDNPNPEYWEYSGDPPDRKYYRTWKDEDATWFQVWETVSEGTPVTPPFATKDELIEYLVANGDFWDQSRRKDRASGRQMFGMNCDPWKRSAAVAFVNGPGWAPSMVMDANGLRSGVESLGDK